VNLACVVHRFGADIAGGSEGHCRAVAEHLAARHTVTIITTCAKDHITWRNHYPPGESTLGPLRVLRFPVARERHLHRFMDLSDLVFADRASGEEQEQWFRENGPDAPELIDHLRVHGAEYDRVLFWSYRYADTYFGLPHVADRAVLVPTAEEDPLIHVDAVRTFFSRPRGFLFLTPEEQALVGARAPAGRPSDVIGSGLDPAAGPANLAVLDTLRLHDPFVLYLGRIDPNKGCGTLLRQFLRYVELRKEREASLGAEAPSAPAFAEGFGASTEARFASVGGKAAAERDVQLVMAGPSSMPIPAHPLIRPLGFVDDDVRDALLSKARALVMPSPFESLSMVLLEAWNRGLPALVNARCKVLRGQVERANGGLYYGTAAEFMAALDYLLDRPADARQLGQQGLAYVDHEYRWGTVMAKIEAILQAS
jgi:glycosyltransferase involved in cell wall biosynthesis